MTTHDPATLWTGSEIDPDTQALILDWFSRRQIPDDFDHFFRRTAKSVDWQYNQLIRLESVQWDPMVSDYLERQIVTTGKGTTKSNGSTTQSGKIDGTTSGTNNNTTTTETSSSDTLDSTGTSQNDNNVDNKQLSGATPDSATYQDQFPETLNWRYLSSQGETRQSTSDNGSTTNNTTSSGSSTTETTANGGSSSTNSSTSNLKTDNNNDTTTQQDSDVRERQTGRHEAPQDMMERARTYIMHSNAFLWLVDKLSPCFYGLFEV